jgi:hypothetical protein
MIMEKVAYDIVVIEAMRLLDKAVSASIEYQASYFQQYSNYLSSMGWTDAEFDAEMLKRIDQNWTDTKMN